jgi:cobalt-zinc-cadmium efflux system outer membrane protein
MIGLWVVAAMAADVRMLTYEDALEATEAANPQLRRAALSSDVATADVRSALGTFDPTLSLTGGWDRRSSLQFQPPFPDPFNSTFSSWNLGTSLSGTAPTGTTVTVNGSLFSFRQSIETEGGDFTQNFYQPSFTVGLKQELLRGVKLAFNMQNIRMAKEGQTLAELQLASARQEALAATAKAYWSWVQATRLAEIARASVAVAEEGLRVGKSKVAAGQLAPLEQTRLEAALIQARTSAVEAEHGVFAARDQLLLLMGEQPGQELAPGSAVGDAAAYTLELASAVDVALAQSASLAVQRARVEQARQVVQDARHATLPTLTANLDAGVNGGDGESWGQAFELLGGFPTFSIGGTFAVPLGNRASTGQLQRASAQVAVEQATLTEQERQLAADVGQQVRALEMARQKVSLAEANVVLAEETLRAEESLAAAGRAILKDVLESRDGVAKARVEVVRARTDVRLAEVELLRLQGGLGAP